MASPFPGMDPYLEDPNIWPGFHHSLADEIKAQLNARIGPKYFADVNLRTVFEEVVVAIPHALYPDVGVYEQRPTEAEGGLTGSAVAVPAAPVLREIVIPGATRLRTVEVHLTETGELVTAIELLSPYHKRPGKGLEEYRQKRLRLLRSPVHLIEVDLLRGGQRPGKEVNEPPLEGDYVLLVNRYCGEHAGRISESWPVALDQPLPLLPVPLLPPDPDVPLDLNATLGSVHIRAGYEWRINYQNPVPPPDLHPAMADWLKQRLAGTGR